LFFNRHQFAGWLGPDHPAVRRDYMYFTCLYGEWGKYSLVDGYWHERVVDYPGLGSPLAWVLPSIVLAALLLPHRVKATRVQRYDPQGPRGTSGPTVATVGRSGPSEATRLLPLLQDYSGLLSRTASRGSRTTTAAATSCNRIVHLHGETCIWGYALNLVATCENL
jgi:hypothetical protein